MDMREKLAKLAHEQWSGWIKHMWRKCIAYKPGEIQGEKGALIVPKWAVERWTQQANTKYDNLSIGEKDSDRIEADRFLTLFNEQIKQLETEIEKLKEAMEHIIEYWNKDENHTAMSDALDEILTTAEQSLKN